MSTVSPGPVRAALWTDPDKVRGQLARMLGAQDESLAAQPRQTGIITGRMLEPAKVVALIVRQRSPVTASIGADYVIDVRS